MLVQQSVDPLPWPSDILLTATVYSLFKSVYTSSLILTAVPLHAVGVTKTFLPIVQAHSTRISHASCCQR